ncbi:hypothetical protein R1flu_022217 [Riccia fluitans]|uniref:Uncharacterized protein n=1 Tax=Riccia fluitans TaxID=41844 RepID=A0ABD1ZRL3_9MARC
MKTLILPINETKTAGATHRISVNKQLQLMGIGAMEYELSSSSLPGWKTNGALAKWCYPFNCQIGFTNDSLALCLLLA